MLVCVEWKFGRVRSSVGQGEGKAGSRQKVAKMPAHAGDWLKSDGILEWASTLRSATDIDFGKGTQCAFPPLILHMRLP